MKKGIILVLMTAFISGFSIFLNKFAVSVFNPQIFTTMKNLTVVIFLISLMFLCRDFSQLKLLTRKDWLKLIIIGLVGGSLPFLLFFQGLTLTTSAKAGFIHKTMFIYVGILATIFLREKLNKKIIIGLISLIFGNILFLKIKPQALQLGDLLVFLATLFWSLEIIISKKLLMNLKLRLVIFGRMFFGAIFMLTYLLFTKQLFYFAKINQPQIVWLIITAALLFGYVLTFYSGLQKIPASVATAVLSIGAPITLIFNIIFLGNGFSLSEIIGLGLMIIGLIIVIQVNSRKIKILKLIPGRFRN